MSLGVVNDFFFFGEIFFAHPPPVSVFAGSARNLYGFWAPAARFFGIFRRH
jgi:hypothetical protein